MISRDEKLKLTNDSLTSSNGYEVMMNWEYPIMKKMAEEVCKNGGHILEVGYGMGISSLEIQKQNIESHTIIEINQGVYESAKILYQNNTKVRLILSDVIDYIESTNDKFDGIFFDPFPSDILGVGDDGLIYGKVFFDKIKRICNPGCRVVPFLLACREDQSFLINDVPLKGIEEYDIVLEEPVKCSYFIGDRAKVFVFNI